MTRQNFSPPRFSRLCAAASLALLASLVWCVPAAGAEAPRYVFLFIGDGMGPSQCQLAEIASQHRTGTPLVMETLPVRGAIHTRSANSAVTDSAAAGTAMAAGVKTRNGMVGVTPDGEPVEPLCVPLRRAGMKIGLISSVPLNHATPAAFFAHSRSRNAYDEISAQLPGSGVNLVVGNGLMSPAGRQEEVMAAWEAAGVTVARTVAEVTAADPQAQVVGVLGYPPAYYEHRDDPSGRGTLADCVSAAVTRLDGPDGFFLMIEGGKIDWSGHANDAGSVIEETLAMDRAVAVAQEFLRKRPTETLIVVTSDHETGGMQLDQARVDIPRLLELVEKRGELANALNAEEPLSAALVDKAMAEVLGIEDLAAGEREQIDQALQVKQEQKRRRAVHRAAMNIAQARAGVLWTTGGHTGVDVPVYAAGVGAERFAGEFDNTQLPGKLLGLCLPGSPAALSPGAGASPEPPAAAGVGAQIPR